MELATLARQIQWKVSEISKELFSRTIKPFQLMHAAETRLY